MYMHSHKSDDAEAQRLRREGGRWLKEQRLRTGLSQREMAERVGARYYTFISQLENGRGRIPPDRYADWAKVLALPSSTFVYNIMRFYDPVTHQLLFEDQKPVRGQGGAWINGSFQHID